MKIQQWTSSHLSASIAPRVAATPPVKPTAATKMGVKPSTGQEATGGMMMPEKLHTSAVRGAEGTGAAMKKMSSSMVTEVVVEGIGTAPGVKRRSGVPAAGGTGTRVGTRKLVRMVTETCMAPGGSGAKKSDLIDETGNAQRVFLTSGICWRYKNEACWHICCICLPAC